jgi:hypothetical protein
VWCRLNSRVNRCLALSDTVTLAQRIVEHPKPRITYDGVLLHSTEATFYNWMFNGKFINGAIDKTYQPKASGFYSVLCLFDSVAQCNEMSDEMYVGVSTGINLNEEDDVRVFMTEQGLSISSSSAIRLVKVYTVLGECVAVWSGDSSDPLLALVESAEQVLFVVVRRADGKDKTFVVMNQ